MVHQSIECDNTTTGCCVWARVCGCNHVQIWTPAEFVIVANFSIIGGPFQSIWYNIYVQILMYVLYIVYTPCTYLTVFRVCTHNTHKHHSTQSAPSLCACFPISYWFLRHSPAQPRHRLKLNQQFSRAYTTMEHTHTHTYFLYWRCTAVPWRTHAFWLRLLAVLYPIEESINSVSACLRASPCLCLVLVDFTVCVRCARVFMAKRFVSRQECGKHFVPRI